VFQQIAKEYPNIINILQKYTTNKKEVSELSSGFWQTEAKMNTVYIKKIKNRN